MKLNLNSILFKSTDEMRAICKPILDNTPITYFEYVRLYKSGKVIKLDTEDEVLPYILSNDLYLKPQELVSFDRYTMMTHSLPKEIANIKSDTLQHYHDQFNLGHFFFINEECTNYFESFVFGGRPSDSNLVAFYLNNLDLLDKFSLYFKVNAGDLIESASKEAIILPEWRDALLPQITPVDKSISDQLDLTSIKFKIEGIDVTITKRELQCLKRYLLGKTMKYTAKELKISHRTVETHLTSIKRKLNCTTRQELFSFIVGEKLERYLLQPQ